MSLKISFDSLPPSGGMRPRGLNREDNLKGLILLISDFDISFDKKK
jgi:hypothetical protein